MSPERGRDESFREGIEVAFRTEVTEVRITELQGEEITLLPTCDSLGPWKLPLNLKSNVSVAGKPADPAANPPVQATPEATVRNALKRKMDPVIRGVLKDQRITCHASCKNAIDQCVIQVSDPIVCSTGYVYDDAADEYKEIVVCSVLKKADITVMCTCATIV